MSETQKPLNLMIGLKLEPRVIKGPGPAFNV